MAGLNWQELLLIAAIVLALFAVGKLLELSGLLGRGIGSRAGAVEQIEMEPEASDVAEADN